jgi:glycosyltransferase involved in cell wall biosynthesis
MHIVFDLQAAATRAPAADASETGAHGLRLALALARSAEAHEHRVSLLVPADAMEGVVCIRRLLEGLPADRMALRVWQPLQGATSWHREANAVLYRQLLGRLEADAVVLDDPSGHCGHPLAGVPDWLPAACRGIFLAKDGTQLSDLPGDPSVWAQAMEDHRVALCALRAGEAGTPPSAPGLVLPLQDPRSDDADDAARAARALSEVLDHLRPGASAAAVRLDAPSSRPRLAYVSPLPPARTGIADYSADLVAALAAHYDIDLVVDQADVDLACLPSGAQLRSVEWFVAHGNEFDRILYHFGNSPFHQHMPALCERFPGTVVLHDFYLGDLVYYLGDRARDQGASWLRAYYRSHGYGALRDAMRHDQRREVLDRYPVNLEFLRRSRGVIVHSGRACELAAQWLPPAVADRFRHIPLLRIPVPTGDRQARRMDARRSLGIAPERFLVCCFGMVGQAKANLEILQAWLRMDEAVGGLAELVFVGANEEGAYGRKLSEAIAAAGKAKRRIRITGWIDADGYRGYLEAADVAVQLRTIDRGETSAAVLDCMNYGLATVVNRKGSMAELPPEAVCLVPAECNVQDIADALTKLHRDPAARAALADAAAELLHRRHMPAACAQACHDVLENDFYRYDAGLWEAAVPLLAKLPGAAGQDREAMAALGNATAATLPALRSGRQLLVDVSAICNNDLRTGIQRVVRALLVEMIESPPPGYRIEPVYLCSRTGAWQLLYARQYTLGLLGLDPETLADEVVEGEAGDLFLGLDFSSGYIVEAVRMGVFDRLRRSGVAMHFVIYDLLPLLRPEVFPMEAHAAHELWLRAILGVSDEMTCISHAVAGELRQWISEHAPGAPTRISAFHLGADVMASAPTYGMPDDAPKILAALRKRPTFLAVGTIEPRKGIAQTLAAFELLWQQGVDVNLVLVGKPGWHVEALVEALKKHEEKGRRLFWLAGISDEYLEAVYGHADCLLTASEAEGFGLPLIEAAQKGLPILARDIPVFREVAGKHALYFSGTKASDLTNAVIRWLKLYEDGTHPTSREMPWLTWHQSAMQLAELLRIS